MDRRWGIVFALNFIAISLMLTIVAWWERAFSFGGLGIAAAGALVFTLRQRFRPWWTTENANESVWRKRYLQDAVMWGIVLVILIFVLLSTGRGAG